MKSTILTLFAAIVISLSLKAQVYDWQWANNANPMYDLHCFDIATDSDGNSYIVGRFGDSTITFGTTTLTNESGTGYYIVKYDSLGTVLWAQGSGGTGNGTLMATSVITDASDNVYMYGYFRYSVTFGSITLTATSGDIFIVKYDSDGNVIWATQANSTNLGASPSGMSLDGNGYLYITGMFSAPDILIGHIPLTSGFPGSGDVFVAKYDTSGNVIWARSATGDFVDNPKQVAADANGNVYVVGYYSSSTITFGSQVLTNSVGDSSKTDLFIVKYDASGNVVWAIGGGGDKYDEVKDVVVDASGDIYATGFFSGTTLSIGGTSLIGNAACTNMFLLKLNPQGSVIWAKSSEHYTNNNGYGISIDEAGNTYVGGDFYNTLDIGSFSLTGSGIGSDIFLAKFDVNGNIVFAISAGGANFDRIHAISTDNFGNAYVAGIFTAGEMVLGNITLTSDTALGDDLFVARVSTPNITSVSDLINLGSGVRIYPNPLINSAIVEINLEAKFENENVEFVLYDILGQEISRQRIVQSTFGISRGDLPSGTYFYKISTVAEDISAGKLIVE